MHHAGFRVLGFGIESFSVDILREFNKAQIRPFIVPVLQQALRLGITPFLDMILTSPHCSRGSCSRLDAARSCGRRTSTSPRWSTQREECSSP
jgi:hypothetical protein